MKEFMTSYICEMLRVADPAQVEIEAKKKLSPATAENLRRYLSRKKKVRRIKSASFMDQFLDTSDFDIFRSGASLRIRYKGDGSNVYLQYKGRGFTHKGILFRSEFSSGRIKGLVKEESLHDMIRFAAGGLRKIMAKFVPVPMRKVLWAHLGPAIIARVTAAPVICFYRKEKYLVKTGGAYLEPSLDHISAFRINEGSFHSVSNFWEYENEIKSEGKDLAGKLERIRDLLEFDSRLAEKFPLYPEVMDKYHRVLSCFMRVHPPSRRKLRGTVPLLPF
ncbi:MAG: hypothetical protein FD189_1161 [Elusimicrobia bacterium]|nr:MAG: hypothetical protein FD154_868 [Elusimicrobiota bacterium]KAF0156117.1 MAG: hypothetical protein FD189_1161 [Elusimicrobiota bacterium]